MTVNLPQPPRLQDWGLERHLVRVQQTIEQTDRQNLKYVGDIDFAHSLRVRGSLTVDGTITAAFIICSVATGITASVTQTQGQQPLTASSNLVETVANANDVVTLPAAVAGLHVEVVNAGANVLQIFPASGDSIHTGAVDVSVTLSVDDGLSLRAFDSTAWRLV